MPSAVPCSWARKFPSRWNWSARYAPLSIVNSIAFFCTSSMSTPLTYRDKVLIKGYRRLIQLVGRVMYLTLDRAWGLRNEDHLCSKGAHHSGAFDTVSFGHYCYELVAYRLRINHQGKANIQSEKLHCTSLIVRNKSNYLSLRKLSLSPCRYCHL